MGRSRSAQLLGEYQDFAVTRGPQGEGQPRDAGTHHDEIVHGTNDPPGFKAPRKKAPRKPARSRSFGANTSADRFSTRPPVKGRLQAEPPVSQRFCPSRTFEMGSQEFSKARWREDSIGAQRPQAGPDFPAPASGISFTSLPPGWKRRSFGVLMSIMWMKNHAKWVVIAATILVALGLVFMDRVGASRQGYGVHGDYVGSVDGEEISTGSFQQELTNYMNAQEMQTGKAPEGVELAQLRENLFQFQVKSLLIQRIFSAYRLVASVQEMQEYLLTHPLDVGEAIARYEGPDRVPVFLRDSTLDTLRYRNWLSQDSIYDRLGMRAMEEQLKSSTVPQLQLQQLLRSQLHRTDLEEAFTVETREDLGRIRYYAVSADSFPVAVDQFSDAELKAHYDASPDSFYFPDEAARLPYVRIPIRPTIQDTELMFNFAKELKQRALGGESFAELAKSYSNDSASADSGGRLGGFQPRGTWVPAFSDAVFKLKPGEISDPVLTRFGYHVIKLNALRLVDSVPQADVSHILLKITAGTETIDSLTDYAQSLQAEAEKNGLDAMAKEHGLAVDTTPIFAKGNLVPLGTHYLQGVESFAFSPHERKEKVSDVLQNNEGIYIFARGTQYPAGRNFERAKAAIAADLARTKKRERCHQALESLRPQIVAQTTAFAPRLGMAVLDSTVLMASDGYVPVFGYSSPELLRCFRQPPDAWGPVRDAEHGAVIAQLLQTQNLDSAALAQKARANVALGDGYLLKALYQQWLTDLPQAAKVENQLDLVYRN